MMSSTIFSLRELSDHPLLFGGGRTWVLPLEYADELRLRLDNNIFFYEETPLGDGFSVYESYAVRGGSPVTKMLFNWNPGMAPFTAGAPMYLLGNRGDLNGAVLRNSWFTQLFVTIKNGIPRGAYVDIFDELQARVVNDPTVILGQIHKDLFIHLDLFL